MARVRKHSLLEDNMTMLAMAGIAGAFVLWHQAQKKKGASIDGAVPSIGHVYGPQSVAPGLIGCDCGTEF
jgi:hypothetical protein